MAIELIYCPACKHKVSSEAEKCPNCGHCINFKSDIKMKKCPACGNRVSPNAGTCPQCGHKVPSTGTWVIVWLFIIGNLMILLSKCV